MHFIKDESGSLKIGSLVEYVDSIKTKEFEEKMVELVGGPLPF